MNTCEDRWNGAITQNIACDLVIQIAGTDDLDGHTCFARLHGESQNKKVTLQMVVREVQRIISEFHSQPSSQSKGQESHVDLIRIGAVWVIPNDNRNRPRRALIDDSTMDISNYTIRIHHGAKRFWNVYNYHWGMMHTTSETDKNSKNGVILYEDISLGFAVLNKPSGVPVHSYVYNAGKSQCVLCFKVQQTNLHFLMCL